MTRAVWNLILDVTLLVAFLLLCWTSLVLRFVFPPGSASAGWLLWGGNYDAWYNFHFGTLAVIALAILLHIMLHWNWVCGILAARVLRKKGAGKVDDGTQTIWGVVLLIAIFGVLGVALTAAQFSISAPGA